MKKKKQEKRIDKSRRSKILEKISSFADEGKILNSIRSDLLWIKRIIDFIDNEFPKKKKYEKIKANLESMIKNKSYAFPNVTNFKSNVMAILLDLATTYDLDLSSELVIKFHPKVQEISLNLFKNGHYAQAIFESIKALNNYVKDKSNITDKDLSDAMAKAFNEQNPIIKLNDLTTRSDIDEQRGFKLLFMGAMTGIRNPKAHENIIQLDKNRTLEYLAFISLLFRRAEEGKL